MGPGMALTRSILTPAALALALLAGCGAVLPGLGGGKAPAVGTGSITRERLESYGVPIMRATVPGLGIDTLLSPRDSTGDVTTWQSAEGFTFSFRDGVLIETRGLGPDLMSASGPTGRQIVARSNTGRSYFYTWENDANQRRDYRCTVAGGTAESIEIYGRSHGTQLLTETCQNDTSRLGNKFWIEGQTIRKSQQWISPKAGFGIFILVVGG